MASFDIKQIRNSRGKRHREMIIDRGFYQFIFFFSVLPIREVCDMEIEYRAKVTSFDRLRLYELI